MATNILSIPFRKTKQLPVAELLKTFISTTLDQHPEQFKDDLATLDKLRADIVTLDVHPGSLERLLRYHGHLLTLSNNLPVDVPPSVSPLTSRLASPLPGIPVSVLSRTSQVPLSLSFANR
jgi:hypothetical protein